MPRSRHRHPSRAARNRHAQALANQSPVEAIAFVNGIPKGETDRQTITAIAQTITRQLGERAIVFGEQLIDESRRDLFREHEQLAEDDDAD